MDRRRALTRSAVLTAPLLFAGPARALVATLGANPLRFATLAQGRALLGADDDWVVATSELQRRATLGANTPVSREQLRAFCADAVLPWPAPLEARWAKALAMLAPRYAELRIPLPLEVLLIHTNGRDAANAPYTRRNAVVLPIGSAPDANGDAFVLAHELFPGR